MSDNSPPGASALLIIDMINDLTFEGGEELKPQAEAIADAILNLRADADRFGLPVVYINDNYGEWRSERDRVVEACSRPDSPGRALVARMLPRDSDYFVIKPHLSGFYATNLPALLPRLGANRLIVTGIAADICVLFTAADAHMRAYDIWVPSNAIASRNSERRCWALEIMRESLGAETQSTSDLSLQDWAARAPPSASSSTR